MVIQHDFYHIWHPYLHVTMEYLHDYFEIVDQHVLYQSRVYRHLRAIPDEEIARVARYDFTLEQRAALLARSAAASPPPMRDMLEALAVCDAQFACEKDLYFARKAEFERAHPGWRQADDLWAFQFGRLENREAKAFGAEAAATPAAPSGDAPR